MSKFLMPGLILLFSTVSALAQNGSGPRTPAAAAPEIDGPGGVAAVALLVSAGLIAYNRFRKK